MSGIYIPGMEMPDRCYACPMCSDTDCCGISHGSYIEYRGLDVEVAIDHRPDWCPLIPVPDHGRLIDADALLKDIAPTDEDEDNGAKLLMNVFCQVVKTRPTIIPADGKDGAE